MFNWLRRKLRGWLGVEDSEKLKSEVVSEALRIAGLDSGNGRHSIVHRIALLNNAIVNQGKSFEKQLQQQSIGLRALIEERSKDCLEALWAVRHRVDLLESSDSLQRELKKTRRRPAKKRARR